MENIFLLVYQNRWQSAPSHAGASGLPLLPFDGWGHSAVFVVLAATALLGGRAISSLLLYCRL